MRKLKVAPLSKGGQAWEMLAALSEEAAPVNAVECIFEIYLEGDFIERDRVTLVPLADNSDACFSSQRLGHTDLKRKEKGLGSFPVLAAQAFRCQAAKCFPDGDWTHTTILFR